MAGINIIVNAQTAAALTELTRATAGLANMQAAMNSLAQQSLVAGANTAQLTAQMQALAMQSQAAQNNVQRLSEEYNHLSGAAQATGSAHAGFAREIVVLAHEIDQGNFSRFGGSLMVLAERSGNLSQIFSFMLSPIGMATAALGALAAAAVYLEVQSVKTSNALGQVAINAQLLGNFSATKASITALADEIAKLGNTSKKTVTAYLGSAAELKGGTNETMEGLAVAMEVWAMATGKDSKTVREEFAKVAKDLPNGAVKIVEAFGDATAAQIAEAREAEKTGNQYRAVAVILQVIAQSTKNATAAIVEQRGALSENIWDVIKGAITETAEAEAGMAAETSIADQILQKTGLTLDQLIAKNLALAESIKKIPIRPQQAIANADSAADTQGGKQKEIDAQQLLNDTLGSGLAAAKRLVAEMEETGNTEGLEKAVAEVNKLTTALEQGVHAMQTLQLGDFTQVSEQAVTKLQSTWNSAQSSMHAASAQLYRDSANDARANAEQRRALKQKADEQDIQGHKAAGTELVEQNRVRIAQINADETLSATQRLSKTKAIYQQETNDSRLSYNERLSAERSVAQTTTQLHNVAVSEQMKGLQDLTNEAVRGSNERVQAAQNEVNAATKIFGKGSVQAIEAQHHLTEAIKEQVDLWTADYEKGMKRTLESTKINEAQKLEIVRNALASIGAETTKNKALIERLRDDEVQQERKAAQEKIAIDKEWQNQRIAAAKSAQQNNAADVNIDVQLWRKSYAQKAADLTSYELQTYNTEMKALQQRLALYPRDSAKWNEVMGEMVTTTRQKDDSIAQITRTMIQEQIQEYQQLVHAITGPVGNAVTGLITKTMTMQQAIQSIFQSMVSFIIDKIMEWVEMQIVAMIMGDTSAKTGNAAQVMSNAAVAASGAFAATAAIPYIGPELAPEAAAMAYAATAAYAPLASLDVGAWNVPSDMPANIHQGEMVVPQNFAEGIRSGSASAMSGGGGDSYHITIQAVDSRSVQQLFMQHGSTLVKSLAAQKRNFNTGLT